MVGGGGGGSRNPRWSILAPTQIYTVMTIKTSKTGRTVVKCSEKQFLCVINKKKKKKKIHFLAWYKGWGPSPRENVTEISVKF